MQEIRVQSLGREDRLEKEMTAHSSILAWETHGQRSMAGCSPWCRKKPDTTERLVQSVNNNNISMCVFPPGSFSAEPWLIQEVFDNMRGGEERWFVAFAYFYGINTLTMDKLKFPI